MRHWALGLLAGFLLVAGCGGESASKSAAVSGTVLDIDNNPVRDALVSSKYGNTRTSPTGAFTLPKQAVGAVDYTAEVVRNGVHYRGRTTSFNYSNETTQSVNIVVGPADELGSVSGTVKDRNGNLLQDASVYAYNGAGSSMRAFTDENGQYNFPELVGGVTYTVLAGGQGFRSDSTTINLGIRDSRTADFILDNPGLPNLQPPQNLAAVSWVSPEDATRRPGGDPYDAIKRMLDPRRANRKGSASKSRAPGGTLYEVDLFWDEQRFPDLLGYGIYRSASANGELAGLDFLPEPLAAFYVDMSVRPRSTYSYAVTTISAQFPDLPDRTESALSDRVVAHTLDRLDLLDPDTNPLTFRWSGGSGAENYSVYLFDEFPSIGVQSIWNTGQNRVNGTSFVYDGPQLPKGTYYFMVVGWADSDQSRTISQIGTVKL